MTVDAILTRELDIRFIDARALTVNARIALGIHGYPSKEEERKLVKEARKIFQQIPEEVRSSMKMLKADLDDVKAYDLDNSERSASTSASAEESVDDISSSHKFKLW